MKCRIYWCTAQGAEWCECHGGKRDAWQRWGTEIFERKIREYTEACEPGQFWFCSCWFEQGRPSVVGGFVYLAHCAGLYKIGHSVNVKQRLRELQTGSAHSIELVSMMEGGREVEQRLHDQFSADRVRGEWFKPSTALLHIFAVYPWFETARSEGVEFRDKVHAPAIKGGLFPRCAAAPGGRLLSDDMKVVTCKRCLDPRLKNNPRLIEAERRAAREK